MYNVRECKEKRPRRCFRRSKSVRFPPEVGVKPRKNPFLQEISRRTVRTCDENVVQPCAENVVGPCDKNIKQTVRPCDENIEPQTKVDTKRSSKPSGKKQRNVMVPPIHPENYARHLHWSEETISIQDDTQQKTSTSSTNLKSPTPSKGVKKFLRSILLKTRSKFRKKPKEAAKEEEEEDDGEEEEEEDDDDDSSVPETSSNLFTRVMQMCGLRTNTTTVIDSNENDQNPSIQSCTSTIITRTDDKFSLRSSTSDRKRFERIRRSLSPVDASYYLTNRFMQPVDRQKLELYVLGRRREFNNEQIPENENSVYDDGFTRKRQPMYYRSKVGIKSTRR